MDITFSGMSIRTPVYVKLNAEEQLLLSEGVCRQLGSITYHHEVFAKGQEDCCSANSETAQATTWLTTTTAVTS